MIVVFTNKRIVSDCPFKRNQRPEIWLLKWQYDFAVRCTPRSFFNFFSWLLGILHTADFLKISNILAKSYPISKIFCLFTSRPEGSNQEKNWAFLINVTWHICHVHRLSRETIPLIKSQFIKNLKVVTLELKKEIICKKGDSVQTVWCKFLKIKRTFSFCHAELYLL